MDPDPARPAVAARLGLPVPRDGAEAAAEAERRLVAALRAGDQAAFAALVDAHSSTMLRVAMGYVGTRAVAEEVVQDTWLALLRGLDRFEGRSSIKTWLFHVLVNIAKTRGVKERRTTPFSSLGPAEVADDAMSPTVDPSRFRGLDDPWPHHWAQPPRHWDEIPDQRLVAAETIELVRSAIEELPERQRVVVTLRDVEGLDSDEVCDLLGLTTGNQRVLLHRGRARVRQVLEDYLADAG